MTWQAGVSMNLKGTYACGIPVSFDNLWQKTVCHITCVLDQATPRQCLRVLTCFVDCMQSGTKTHVIHILAGCLQAADCLQNQPAINLT